MSFSRTGFFQDRVLQRQGATEGMIQSCKVTHAYNYWMYMYIQEIAHAHKFYLGGTDRAIVVTRCQGGGELSLWYVCNLKP